MESVKTTLFGKPVFLLGGAKLPNTSSQTISIEKRERLLEVAKRNPDAVAFGFIHGSWVAAA